MDKFKSIAILTAILIFSITGESQDPIALRLIISIISALRVASFYCAFTEDSLLTPTIVLLAASLIAATLADPDLVGLPCSAYNRRHCNQKRTGEEA